jgi:hypothetical protein
MRPKTPVEIAESFGLTVEAVSENEKTLRVCKGVHQIFIGTEEELRSFLVEYDKKRPPLYASNMYGYKE